MKKKQSENYLEYVPQRTPETEFTEDEAGIVTLTKEWTGFYNRIAQRFPSPPGQPHRPGRLRQLHLEAHRREADRVRHLPELDEAYPGMEKSLSRLIKFLEILRDHHSLSGKRGGEAK